MEVRLAITLSRSNVTANVTKLKQDAVFSSWVHTVVCHIIWDSIANRSSQKHAQDQKAAIITSSQPLTPNHNGAGSPLPASGGVTNLALTMGKLD
jgi:hypothetical protein